MAGAQVLPMSTGSQLNGYSTDEARPDTPVMLHQLTQFDKVLKLREDVVNGQHPTLKLVEATSHVPSPQSAQPAASSQKEAAAAVIQDSAKRFAHGAGANQGRNLSAESRQLSGAASKVSTVSQPPKSHIPDFDPILLTKSEPLKRAEVRLERQRIEKKLEEQLHQKRFTQKREPEQDSLPEFDVNEVFAQAQELVKPLAASEVNAANDNANKSNSADDSTFYSSQHNESDVEERADVRATKPCRFFFEGKCLKGDRCDWSHDPAFRSKMGTTAEGYEVNGAANSARRALRPSPTYGPAAHISTDQGMEDGEINEGSYSPPRHPPPIAPDAVAQLLPTAPPEQTGHLRQVRHEQDPRGPTGDIRTTSIHERRRSGRHSPPAGNARFVQDTITSPLAPQPARVSPLAVAKYPRVERVRQIVEDQSPRAIQQAHSVDQSPGSAQASTPRKRPRRQSPSDVTRNVAQRRQADSPEPYIKPEPISPAPLGEMPPRQLAQQVEPKSPVFYRQIHTGDGRVVYEEVRMPRVPAEPQYLGRAGSPMERRRVVSGPGQAYGVRREPELRRVVSSRLQMRAASPLVEYNRATPQREFYAPSATHDIHRRPSSRANIPTEREPAGPYRASIQPLPAPADVRQTRPGSPHSPAVEMVQAGPVRRDSPGMAPPRRTIMVDKYGRQYYEQPPAPEYVPAPRASVAPEYRYAREAGPPAGHTRPSAYPEPMRAPEERFVQRHSPEPPSPRYVEYREMQHPRAVSRAASRAPVVYERTQNGDYGPVIEYAREYRVQEPPPPSRMGPARASMVPLRQPIYLDEREPVYERSYRAPTAQPEVIRYIDAPRSGNVVRQVPGGMDEPVEYREPPRQVYQYVEGPTDLYGPRYAGAVMVDEHGRRIQRM